MRSKFIVYALVIIVVTTASVYSCKKNDTAGLDKKTAIGLTGKEIKELEVENPTLKIDLSKYHEGKDRHFVSKSDAQSYLDSLKTLYRLDIDTVKHAVNVTHQLVSETSLMAPGPCSPGVYSASVGSAGIFSNFSITFQYGIGGVSSAALSLTGLHFFSWGNQNSWYYGNSGCSQGDASFGLGALSWTVVYHVNWTFNPSNCMVYFSQHEGGCGGIVTTSY